MGPRARPSHRLSKPAARHGRWASAARMGPHPRAPTLPLPLPLPLRALPVELLPRAVARTPRCRQRAARTSAQHHLRAAWARATLRPVSVRGSVRSPAARRWAARERSARVRVDRARAGPPAALWERAAHLLRFGPAQKRTSASAPRKRRERAYLGCGRNQEDRSDHSWTGRSVVLLAVARGPGKFQLN